MLQPAVHGLTWVELAIRDEGFSKEAIQQAKWCLSHLESEQGTVPFPRNFSPERGMFYSAWKCHLQAGIITLQDGKDARDLQRFEEECERLSKAIEESRTPFIPSYFCQHGLVIRCRKFTLFPFMTV